jgi:hypothetical protein
MSHAPSSGFPCGLQTASGEFREQIAHFCAEIAISAQVREKIVKNGRIVIQADLEFLNSFGRLIYTANKIRLMINPREHDHLELLEQMNEPLKRLRTASAEDDLQAEGQAIVEKICHKPHHFSARVAARATRGLE